ncbi:hypothetical protein ACFP1I_22570 [Dyadobacter subterraneus]|uniref:Glycosyltransferase RgtA/B/C/D-like domain-containing protein n=1 Tax=Dyadobacter subterraneus TaxID=2773304 RepID=A0ABR9WKL8_9BACT|nr:hypothetical protein [Dyadobacter subterraneus]MBE9465451.1 hypothetical protein [Dyadobacter subterraneus]
MQGKLNPNYSLLILWLFHSSLILLLACINPNHYTTIDSQYYLESAKNILGGNGYTIFEEKGFQWNGTFPVGYSSTIALVSFFTKIDVLWASKIVNISATGIWFSLLNLWFDRSKSVLIGCILILGSFLKLWAHTWSEPLFLVILFCWTYHSYQIANSSELSISRTISVLLLGFLLILARYAGIFIIPLSFIFSVYYFQKKEKNKSLTAAFLSVIWSAGFGFYLFLNYQNSGELYGGARFEDNIRIMENAVSFAKGLINEISIFGNFTFHSFEVFSFIGNSFQILLTALIIKELGPKFTFSNWAKHTFLVAFFYLIFLFILRIFSHFDEPGYRLLSPFTFLVLSGLVCGIPDEQITMRLKNLLIVLVVLSWVEIIPKDGLKKKVCKSLQSITHYDY